MIKSIWLIRSLSASLSLFLAANGDEWIRRLATDNLCGRHARGAASADESVGEISIFQM